MKKADLDVNSLIIIIIVVVVILIAALLVAGLNTEGNNILDSLLGVFSRAST